jgi:hypothetical protein
VLVSRYGLHWARGDIPFLVQPSGATNLISPDLPCPFVPQIQPRRQRCPHNVDIHKTVEPGGWIEDPLAAVFLPIPRPRDEKVLVLHDPDRRLAEVIQELSRLASPTESIIHPVWWKKIRDQQGLFGVTNLSPIVWIGVDRHYGRQCQELIMMAQATDRRMLIVTTDRVPLFDGVTHITSELTWADVSNQPLEAYGAWSLRQHMEHARAFPTS